MTRKHSYRELAKRKFAQNVLFYLQDPEDAKSVFQYTKFSDKDKQSIQRAFSTAEMLKDSYQYGNQVSLKPYSPYIKEIREILTKGQPTAKQNSLTLF